jgi:hypothetical protein
MTERHAIFNRRFLDMTPPPWSEDPVFQHANFTNVYRELDRGSLFYLEDAGKRLASCIPESFPHCSPDERTRIVTEMVWHSLCYRLLNRVETFTKVDIPWYTNWRKERAGYEKSLRAIKAQGCPVFTGAHLTCPCPKGVDKIGGYMMALNDAHTKMPKIVEECLALSRPLQIEFIRYRAKQPSPKAFTLCSRIHRALQAPACVGHFIAYEVFCDMAYWEIFPAGEDLWANPGPGCRSGLDFLVAGGRRTTVQYTYLIWALAHGCDHLMTGRQREVFGINWNLCWRPIGSPVFTMRMIEHSLCEYSKYHRLREGKINPKNGFNTPVTSAKGHATRVHNLFAEVRKFADPIFSNFHRG